MERRSGRFVRRFELLGAHAFVLCGLRAGLRLSELIGLRWSDVDWRKGFLHVQRGIVRNHQGTPKSGHDRTVDLSRQLRIELWLLRRRQTADYLKRGLGRPKIDFPAAVNTPLDPSNLGDIFAAIVRKAELRHRSPHAMRHTYISLLFQSGASPAYVQKQAGHKSMDLTIKVYGHFVPGGNREAVDRLDDLTVKSTPKSKSA